MPTCTDSPAAPKGLTPVEPGLPRTSPADQDAFCTAAMAHTIHSGAMRVQCRVHAEAWLREMAEEDGQQLHKQEQKQ